MSQLLTDDELSALRNLAAQWSRADEPNIADAICPPLLEHIDALTAERDRLLKQSQCEVCKRETANMSGRVLCEGCLVKAIEVEIEKETP